MSAESQADNPSEIVPIQLDAALLPIPMVILRAKDGCVMYANLQVGALLKLDVNDLIGKPILGLYDNDRKRSKILKKLKKYTVTPPSYVTLTDSSNKRILISVTAKLAHFDNDLCIWVAIQQASADVVNLKKLHKAMQRYDLALHAAKVGIWSWSLMRNRIAWDSTMHELFGIERGAFTGEQDEILEYIVPEDREKQSSIMQKYYQEGGKFDTKFRVLRPDGETRVIINRGEATKNNQGTVIRVVGVCWDVTENFALTEKLEHQAIHDPLTGLLNRYEMQSRLQKLLDNNEIEFSENTFCFFDIDRFKVVNDTCGHKAGDALLSKIADHLQTYIKKSDSFARIGDDEFAVIITDSSGDDARKVAETLRQAVENFHFEWNGKVFDINISMALVPILSNQTVTEILGSADVALSAAKDSGRNRIHEYRPHDSTMIRRHGEMQWVVELENALREDRFQLNFQPIHPISDSDEVGLHYEVLLRVIKESGEIIAPGELLSAAEQFDMAARVDRWVINAIFDWLKTKPQHCIDLSLCSINLSGSSIGDPSFMNYLQEKLKDKDIPKDKICFEITENAAIKNIKKAANFIKTIKEFGCKFALDDFGSGLSSFAYLKDLPVDILKIDGLFVREINTEQVSYAMVKAINDVGQIMNMKTIAEYVENKEIFEKLKEIGVDYAQGYHVGKSEKLDKTLADHTIIVDSTVAESD